MATLFFSYSHADEALRDMLEKHLTMLKRQGLIETWHDRRIPAGNHIDHSISRELEAADVILLLVSPDFLASSYCYDVEMQRAMERHSAGLARVIPVILRRCDWQGAPFGKLLATPQDAKPVKSFPDLDEAFFQVTQAIRAALETSPSNTPRRVAQPPAAIPPRRAAAQTDAPAPGPRSSNLRLPRAFTDAEKDRFQDEAFEFMARFFENSLDELKARNPGIDIAFKRVDAHQFTATAYRHGQKLSWCRIFVGSRSGGIAFSANEHLGTNGFNECLTTHIDDERIYLKPMGMAAHGSSGSRLTHEGAAEFYWDMFIQPLRQR